MDDYSNMQEDFASYPEGQSSDFCELIISRFTNSTHEHHHHLCSLAGTMSQELKDQNIPLSNVAYFGATTSSLDRLSSEAEPPSHVLEALLSLLSMLLPRVAIPIIRNKAYYLSNILIRALRLKSATPGGVAAGLKCVSHLLIVLNKSSWTEISSLYGSLLSYATDSNLKVRKQSHVCLRDILLAFQRMTVLAPASEGITNAFEKFLLLAGGSSKGASEGPKGAQEVLYVLDALKDCLPLMSLNSSTSVLKLYGTLLGMKQPLVTRRITASLNSLSLCPTTDINSEVFLDLLCSLATSVSLNEMTADDMTFTARLLDVGVRKIHLLHGKNCANKLSLIFNALKDILASEHEEALHAATEAFKSLLNVCIDESLIQQGINQIMANEIAQVRKSGPTVIEKICAIVESLVDYRYAAVWDLSFQVISTMFNKLGVHSFYLLKGTLIGLADMQTLPDEDFPFRKQLHECVGSAVASMGPERFLSIVPLKFEAVDFSESNIWLFPILKQYIIGAKLGYFKDSIFSMVEILNQRYLKLEQEGMLYSANVVDGIIYALWSLLPSFCNYPVDTDKNFEELMRSLFSSLCAEAEEHEVHGANAEHKILRLTSINRVICASLQILIHQNKEIAEGVNGASDIEASIPQKQAIAYYTPQIANNNLKVLCSSAGKLLDVLGKIYLKPSKDADGCFEAVIRDIASIADKVVLRSVFSITMERMLHVIKKANEGKVSKDSQKSNFQTSHEEKSALLLKRAKLLDLAVALLPGLHQKEIDVLFVVIKAALKDPEVLIQKKGYKALSIILKNSDGFLSQKLEELLNLMIEVLPSCHCSSKRYRIDSLYFLVVFVLKDQSGQRQHNIITSFLTEIVLSLKETNKKTRNRAYDLLVQIGHACADEEQGGTSESLLKFFNKVAGGLKGDTPHMISAAIKGLARLAYEFSDLLSAAYNVLPSALILLKRKNRELIKANLGLLKVLVAKSQADGLQVHLKSIVVGLLAWQDDTKNHFKAKIKLLIEMLIKKCGIDAVKAVTPEEHVKLLTNIRKIKMRKDKKHAAKTEETRSHFSKATTSRMSKWNHTQIFSDSGDDESESEAEYTDGTTVMSHQSKASRGKNSVGLKRTRKANNLPEDFVDHLEDEPLDLLDRQKTRGALRSSANNLKRKADSDEDMEIDPMGKIIIREEGGERSNPKRKEEMPDGLDFDKMSLAGSSRVSMNNSSRKGQKRVKTSESGWAYTGSVYSSKKAGGDLTKKGKLEPYAYWPLDRKMMSRRSEHRASARKGISSVVKMTKFLQGKSVANALALNNSKFKKDRKKKVK
ncbi:RRP12-like protein [Impatiens glandulifera]|uniref:RRP12-like protein n=1 Tax=Impatiens glandulifera TaxID=253017 RepID=UPI001FB181FD|nr:RRP12-like protein [Impatiens glandulifera]